MGVAAYHSVRAPVRKALSVLPLPPDRAVHILLAPVGEGYNHIRAGAPAGLYLTLYALPLGYPPHGPAVAPQPCVIAVHALGHGDEAEGDAARRHYAGGVPLLLAQIRPGLHKPGGSKRLYRAEKPLLAPVQTVVVGGGQKVEAHGPEVFRKLVRRIEGLVGLLGVGVILGWGRRGGPPLGITRCLPRKGAFEIARHYVNGGKQGLHGVKAGPEVVPFGGFRPLYLARHHQYVPHYAHAGPIHLRLRRGGGGWRGGESGCRGGRYLRLRRKRRAHGAAGEEHHRKRDR